MAKDHHKRSFNPQWFGKTAGLYFRKLRPHVDSFQWGTFDYQSIPLDLLMKARESWIEAAFNEYCTAVGFSQLLQLLLQINAPLDMIGMISDFLIDEMLHVELATRFAQEIGGGVHSLVDYEALPFTFDPKLSTLQRANELVVRICCVGEAFSLPMLTGCYQNCHHPLTKAILKQIVADEVYHGKFGFLYLEWVKDRLSKKEKKRLSKIATETLYQLSPFWMNNKSYNVGPRTIEGYLLEDIQDLGWMFCEDYCHKAKQTVMSEVVKPLRKFGIKIPKADLIHLLEIKDFQDALMTSSSQS